MCLVLTLIHGFAVDVHRRTDVRKKLGQGNADEVGDGAFFAGSQTLVSGGAKNVPVGSLARLAKMMVAR